MRSESVGSQKGAAVDSKPPNSSCTRAAVDLSVRQRYHLRLWRTIGSLGILRGLPPLAPPPPPSPWSEFRASSEPPLFAGLAAVCGGMPATAARKDWRCGSSDCALLHALPTVPPGCFADSHGEQWLQQQQLSVILQPGR